MDAIRSGPLLHSPAPSSDGRAPLVPAPPDDPQSNPPRDLASLSLGERSFVETAVSDPVFGVKNAFILERFYGYPVHRDLEPGAWVPPAPVPQTQTSDPRDGSASPAGRTFDQIFDATRTGAPVMALTVAGANATIEVVGCTLEEVERVRTALEAIPSWSREFLGTVRQICVASFDAFLAQDGTVSTGTSGVAEPSSGRLLLNRRWLDRCCRELPTGATAAARASAREKDVRQWENTLLHELGHFHDRYLQRDGLAASVAPESPLGNHGVWYTNYAWWVQDPAEDLAEGYALLGQARLQAIRSVPPR